MWKCIAKYTRRRWKVQLIAFVLWYNTTRKEYVPTWMKDKIQSREFSSWFNTFEEVYVQRKDKYIKKGYIFKERHKLYTQVKMYAPIKRKDIKNNTKSDEYVSYTAEMVAVAQIYTARSNTVMKTVTKTGQTFMKWWKNTWHVLTGRKKKGLMLLNSSYTILDLSKHTYISVPEIRNFKLVYFLDKTESTNLRTRNFHEPC